MGQLHGLFDHSGKDGGASMKVGDLVVCASVPGRPVGLIVERFRTSGLFNVMLTHSNNVCCFQPQHLEVISASR